MANPDYEEDLDFLDKLGVVVYRLGISVFAIAAILFAILIFTRQSGVEVLLYFDKWNLVLFACAAAMSAANIHVYSKLVRMIIMWASWIGLLLMVADTQLVWVPVSLGCFFITFCGIALKESFCFNVLGLKFTPVLLAPAVFCMMFQYWIATGVLLLLAGLILFYLSIVKWKMPLHFDIGMKANYQI